MSVMTAGQRVRVYLMTEDLECQAHAPGIVVMVSENQKSLLLRAVDTFPWEHGMTELGQVLVLEWPIFVKTHEPASVHGPFYKGLFTDSLYKVEPLPSQ